MPAIAARTGAKPGRAPSFEAYRRTDSSRLHDRYDSKPNVVETVLAFFPFARGRMTRETSTLNRAHMPVALRAIDLKWRESEEAKQVMEEIFPALKDRRLEVRKEAIELLGRITHPRTFEPLLDALGDEAWQVRRAAAEALGDVGGAMAAERLLAALKDKDSLVREAAARSLAKITGQNFGEDPD
ncbi:MAG: HEAT repeat domain-containing protein, partial [Planctomycetota bacterium]|nr:HEAT repeat domain-containing protein [Planctomycetota bacterium]